MDNNLILLRELVIALIRDCKDADLLDLLYKLLVTSRPSSEG